MGQDRPELTVPLIIAQSIGEYDRLVAILGTLVDLVGEDEAHPLATLMDAVCAQIERYDESTCRRPPERPGTTLRRRRRLET